MNKQELFKINALTNQLKSLELELATVKQHNFYKKNNVTDMPGGSDRTNEIEWYAEEVTRIEKEIAYTVEDIQRARREIGEFIESIVDNTLKAIVRYRVINNLRYEEIGGLLGYHKSVIGNKFRGFYNALED